MFKAIRGPFFNADGGEGGDGSQQPGKTFTQAEVDAMMASRWKDAEMTKTELKEFADLVKGFGYEGATPAELKAQLKQDLDARNKAQELKDLESEADKAGASPELLAAIKKLETQIADLTKDKEDQRKAQEAKQKADEAWTAQVAEFQEKHSDVDMEKLVKNEKFISFLGKANPSIPLVEVYDTYVDLVGGAEKAAIEKIQANADRSTSSGRAKGDPTGGTHGLTDNQQELAKKNGMTYKEYADALKDIS